jgi:hypothetical protein
MNIDFLEKIETFIETVNEELATNLSNEETLNYIKEMFNSIWNEKFKERKRGPNKKKEEKNDNEKKEPE